MPGTREGALKAWEGRRARGDHLNYAFYADLGRRSHIGGFGADPWFARRMAKERWRRFHISRSLRNRAG